MSPALEQQLTQLWKLYILADKLLDSRGEYAALTAIYDTVVGNSRKPMLQMPFSVIPLVFNNTVKGSCGRLLLLDLLIYRPAEQYHIFNQNEGSDPPEDFLRMCVIELEERRKTCRGCRQEIILELDSYLEKHQLGIMRHLPADQCGGDLLSTRHYCDGTLTNGRVRRDRDTMARCGIRAYGPGGMSGTFTQLLAELDF